MYSIQERLVQVFDTGVWCRPKLTIDMQSFDNVLLAVSLVNSEFCRRCRLTINAPKLIDYERMILHACSRPAVVLDSRWCCRRRCNYTRLTSICVFDSTDVYGGQYYARLRWPRQRRLGGNAVSFHSLGGATVTSTFIGLRRRSKCDDAFESRVTCGRRNSGLMKATLAEG